MMHTQHVSKFALGDTVLAGNVRGVVQSILFERDSYKPTYKVDWWNEGDVFHNTFFEDDLTLCAATEPGFVQIVGRAERMPIDTQRSRLWPEGNAVQKRNGYKWPGIVVSAFTTLKGLERVVVECTVPEVEGALHIYNHGQLERKE